MSYSFAVSSPTKAAAIDLVKVEFDNVVSGQPTHVKDRDAVIAAATAFIEMLRDPGDSEVVYINMWGSLGWSADDVFTKATVSIDACVKPVE